MVPPTDDPVVALQQEIEALRRRLWERECGHLNESHLRMIPDAAPVMIWTAGMNRHRDWFNQRWLAFTGRTMEEELGDGWTQRIHWADLQKFRDTYSTAVRARRPFELEFRLLRHDGEYRWLLDHGVPWTVRGEFAGYIGCCIDITERNRMEKATAQLAAVVESSEDAIVSKNLDGTIFTWNAGAERIYGYFPEEVFGKSIAILLPPGRAGEEDRIQERLKRGERVEFFETVRLHKSGTPIDVSLTISPIRDRNGHVIGASHVARDITGKKKLERQLEQRQKMESLGVLAGGVAHDYRNYLTGILGNASMVLDSLPESSPNRALLEDVVMAAERASELTNQLLAYAGKGQCRIRPVNLSEIVRETSRLIRTSIPQSVQLQWQLAEALPSIDADSGQIQQVIMNLVINAAEAIGEAPGTVAVTTTVQQEGNEPSGAARDADASPQEKMVCIEVRDTGCGMDEQTAARIFDPFFTTKKLGRGLGLSAVLGIVRAHNGALKVASSPGKGTTFTLLFPAGAAEPAKEKPAPLGSRWRGHGRILVVDDEEIVRSTAQHGLEGWGFEVAAAENGARAVEIFRREPARFDMVLLDLTMPIKSGVETLRELRAIRPDIPVLLTSGFSEMEAMRRFAGLGLSGFLQKPWTWTQMAEKVRAAIAKDK
ncbi:MAG TPA: PAS domain S-box protein [Bryobacteraceae bacterium]|nr:PAS domain S-box protein [Bryobacteraceae bacterium]